MKLTSLSLLFAAALLVAVPALSGADEVAPCKSCPSSKMAEAEKDIVDTAVGAGSLNTLVTAVKEAGLVETLKGKGPFTVFAPSDEAFAKLPAGTVEGLLEDKAALTKVLTYHVVAGAIPASKVTGLQWAETVQGQSARIPSRTARSSSMTRASSRRTCSPPTASST